VNEARGKNDKRRFTKESSENVKITAVIISEKKSELVGGDGIREIRTLDAFDEDAICQFIIQ
jgi:hypothetical protein